MEVVWRLSGGCLEGVWGLSGGCLGVVWRLSGGCLEGVWRVSGGCLGGVWRVLLSAIVTDVLWGCLEGLLEGASNESQSSSFTASSHCWQVEIFNLCSCIKLNKLLF